MSTPTIGRLRTKLFFRLLEHKTPNFSEEILHNVINTHANGDNNYYYMWSNGKRALTSIIYYKSILKKVRMKDAKLAKEAEQLFETGPDGMYLWDAMDGKYQHHHRHKYPTLCNLISECINLFKIGIPSTFSRSESYQRLTKIGSELHLVQNLANTVGEAPSIFHAEELIRCLMGQCEHLSGGQFTKGEATILMNIFHKELTLREADVCTTKLVDDLGEDFMEHFTETELDGLLLAKSCNQRHQDLITKKQALLEQIKKIDGQIEIINTTATGIPEKYGI